MGAQVGAHPQSRRVLCGVAFAGIGAFFEAFARWSAQGQAVSFLLDTNVVSEWVRPRPNAGVVNWLTQARFIRPRPHLRIWRENSISRNIGYRQAARSTFAASFFSLSLQ